MQAATAATARAPAPAVARAIASMPASAPSLVPAVLELLTTQRVLLGRLQEEAERQSEWRQAVEAREAASWEARGGQTAATRAPGRRGHRAAGSRQAAGFSPHAALPRAPAGGQTEVSSQGGGGAGAAAAVEGAAGGRA